MQNYYQDEDDDDDEFTALRQIQKPKYVLTMHIILQFPDLNFGIISNRIGDKASGLLFSFALAMLKIFRKDGRLKRLNEIRCHSIRSENNGLQKGRGMEAEETIL